MSPSRGLSAVARRFTFYSKKTKGVYQIMTSEIEVQETPRHPVATAKKMHSRLARKNILSCCEEGMLRVTLREKQQSTLTQPDRWIQNGSSGLGSDAMNCHNVFARQSHEYLGHVSTAGVCWSESRMSEKHKNKDA